MGWMALAMVIAALVVAAAVAVISVAALRARRRPENDGGGSARSLLDRRLALGEIDPEEYYEREAALRSGEPVTPRRRRKRASL